MFKVKRFLTVFLAVTMVISSFTVFVSAARDFKDVPADYWAYSYIQTLVNDGTVNGYSDGTFLPEESVTRAEFVKMIGKTSVRFEKDFKDVPKDYWGYDYIMYSDMDVDSDNFRPDEVITRDDVLKLLYKRSGSVKGSIAPSIITSQSTNEDAAAWGYMYGIMQGDDGVNLRLDDGLTRSEAAALICRSRALNSSSTKYSFKNVVNDALLKEAYEQFNLFNDTYDAGRTFTNGEMVEAIMKLATDKIFVNYADIDTDYSVNRPNSFSFYTVCKYVLGKDRMTEEFYDKNVVNSDALAMLMFAAKHKYNKNVVKTSDKNNYYSDVLSVPNDNINAFLSSAYRNGIKLDNTNKIYPDDVLNAKTFALFLIQVDALSGYNSAYIIQNANNYRADVPLNTMIYSYPAKKNNYTSILKYVPNEVYDADFVDEKGKVVNFMSSDAFRFAHDYSSAFTVFLQNLVDATKSYGAITRITFYPSLVVKSDNGYVIKVKVEILDVKDNTQFNRMFTTTVNDDFKLSNGSVFWAEIATGAPSNGMIIPYENAVFTKIIVK